MCKQRSFTSFMRLGASPKPGAKTEGVASGRAYGIKTSQIYVQTILPCGHTGYAISQEEKNKVMIHCSPLQESICKLSACFKGRKYQYW